MRVSEQFAWYTACAALLLAQLAIGLFGIHRGFWLDEAWVANSVHAPTLAGMFYYPEWLQTSPPLFLLLGRSAIRMLGLSPSVLRAVPLVLAMVGLTALLAAARRVASIGFVLLCGALVAFDPVTIEYSHSFKQYSGEMAATCLALGLGIRYAQDPKRFNYLALLFGILALLPLSYPLVFLLPGFVLLLAGSKPRAFWLAASAAAMLGILYILLLQPNRSAQLYRFWSSSNEPVLRPGFLIQMAIVAVMAVRTAVNLARGKRDWRVMTQVLCILPCILLAVAGLAGWYPVTARTRLFLLPCYWLAVAINAEDAVRWAISGAGQRWFEIAAAGAAAVVVVAGMWSQVRDSRDIPAENLAEAMEFLRTHVEPSDLVLIHASEREGFRLEAAMHPWKGPEPRFGNTGWPCCPRGKDAGPGNSNPLEVARELEQMVPRDYAGRVWLFYTNRPSHWKYTGLDEGDAWRRLLWERGCPPDDAGGRSPIGLSLMDCRKASHLPEGN